MSFIEILTYGEDMRVQCAPTTQPQRFTGDVDGVRLSPDDVVLGVHLVMARFDDGIAATQLVLRRSQGMILISVANAGLPTQHDYVVEGTPTLAEYRRVMADMAARIEDAWDRAGAITIVSGGKDTHGMTTSGSFAAFEELCRRAGAELRS